MWITCFANNLEVKAACRNMPKPCTKEFQKCQKTAFETFE